MRRFMFCAAAAVLAACSDKSVDPPASGNLARVSQASTAYDTAARPNDWVFDDRIVVQDAGSSTGWGSYGGSVVDLAKKGERDPLTEIFFHCQLRAIAPTTARDAGNGVLEMSGEERGIPFLDAIVPTQPIGIAPTLRYEFKDELLSVTIGGRDLINSTRSVGCGAVLIKSDAVKGYQEGDWIGGMSPTIKPAFVLTRKQGGILVIAPQADVQVIDADEKKSLRGGGTFEDTYLLSLGNDLEEALARLRDPAELRRSVSISAVVPALLEARKSELVFEIFVESNHSFVTATHKNAALPPGNYVVRAYFEERAVGQTTLAVDAATGPAIETSIPISGLGAVHLLTSAEGRPSPARVRIGNVYESYVGPDATVILPVGDYEVLASHGTEHELTASQVIIAEGETAALSLDVRRAYETPGWIAMDAHIHGTRSVDSQVSRELRILGAIAEDLDVMIATDHDTVTDLSATVEALGVGAMIKAVPGIEMSPLYGHMNGYPLPAQKPESYFKPSWVAYTDQGVFRAVLEPKEIADALRALDAEIVQVNHPRDGSGVFGFIGYDPATATSVKPWPEPDTVELINGKRFEDFPPVFEDLVALWKRGRRVTAVGNSDVHDALGIGYARTLVRVNDASDLSAVWTALREGRAIATSGPFLAITATTAGSARVAEIGDTLEAGAAAEVAVRIEANAPSWMSVQRVELYENGALVYERPVAALPFVDTYTATTTADAFYLAVLRGAASGPEGKQGLAATNPLFVNRP